jgi:hypothetical protein
MASLALIVGIIFLIVVLSGPILYIIAKINILPYFIIDILAVIVLGLGLWWAFIIPTFIRFLGLLTALLGWKAMMLSRKDA